MNAAALYVCSARIKVKIPKASTICRILGVLGNNASFRNSSRSSTVRLIACLAITVRVMNDDISSNGTLLVVP